MEERQVQNSTGKKLLIMIRNLAIYSVLYFIIITGVTYGLVNLAKINTTFGEWFYNNVVFYIIVNDGISLVILYFIAKKLGKVKEAYNFSKIKPQAIILITLASLAMGLFTHAFCKIPAVQENYPRIGGILLSLVNAKNIVIFLVFLLLNSVYKEVLFRGLIYNDLKKALPISGAIVLQGIIYGLLFFLGNIPLTIYGLLGALFFVFLYEWYGTLLAPYIAQVATTGSLYIYVRIIDKYITSNSIKFIIPITIIISAVLIYFIRKNKDLWSYEKKDKVVEVSNE